MAEPALIATLPGAAAADEIDGPSDVTHDVGRAAGHAASIGTVDHHSRRRGKAACITFSLRASHSMTRSVKGCGSSFLPVHTAWSRV